MPTCTCQQSVRFRPLPQQRALSVPCAAKVPVLLGTSQHPTPNLRQCHSFALASNHLPFPAISGSSDNVHGCRPGLMPDQKSRKSSSSLQAGNFAGLMGQILQQMTATVPQGATLMVDSIQYHPAGMPCTHRIHTCMSHMQKALVVSWSHWDALLWVWLICELGICRDESCHKTGWCIHVVSVSCVLCSLSI